MYIHRNGQKEPPTIDGFYWFLGSRNGRHWHYMFIYTGEAFPDCKTTVTAIDDEWEIPFGELDGQWWGPIVPPWDISNPPS